MELSSIKSVHFVYWEKNVFRSCEAQAMVFTDLKNLFHEHYIS